MANRKIYTVELASVLYVHSGKTDWDTFIHRYSPGIGGRSCRHYKYQMRNVARIRALQDALQKRTKESK